MSTVEIVAARQYAAALERNAQRWSPLRHRCDQLKYRAFYRPRYRHTCAEGVVLDEHSLLGLGRPVRRASRRPWASGDPLD